MNIYAQRDTIVQRETLQKNSSIHLYNLAKNFILNLAKQCERSGVTLFNRLNVYFIKQNG